MALGLWLDRVSLWRRLVNEFDARLLSGVKSLRGATDELRLAYVTVWSGRRSVDDEDEHGMVVLAVTTQLPTRVELHSTGGAAQRTRLTVASCRSPTNPKLSGGSRGSFGSDNPLWHIPSLYR